MVIKPTNNNNVNIRAAIAVSPDLLPRLVAVINLQYVILHSTVLLKEILVTNFHGTYIR